MFTDGRANRRWDGQTHIPSPLAPRYAFVWRNNTQTLHINVCLLSCSLAWFRCFTTQTYSTSFFLFTSISARHTIKEQSGNLTRVYVTCYSLFKYLISVFPRNCTLFLHMPCCFPSTCFCSSTFWPSNIRNILHTEYHDCFSSVSFCVLLSLLWI